MPKISLSVADVLSDPNLSLSSSPFAPGKAIIKRASFPKGVTPPHLRQYAIRKGQCAGRTGKVIGPRGNPIPATAACVAEGRRRGRAAAPAA